ncbi:ATP-binding protein [Cellulomonas phragmiteti]|uniref:ATP-binding protein n=1 Tax=Cellulomonas phragmiteti TaxID=478780 RepID=UPI0036454E70
MLFLDEAPEFTSAVLQTLRQPLEHGETRAPPGAGHGPIPRALPAGAGRQPCPCGHATGKGLACTCRPEQRRRRYFGKLSGPLLDRVDLQLEVPPARAADAAGEGTATVAHRVVAARAAQRDRWRSTGWRTNAEVPGRQLHARLGADRALVGDLERAVDRGTLSLRGADRVLRVAWTVADLAGRAAPPRGRRPRPGAAHARARRMSGPAGTSAEGRTGVGDERRARAVWSALVEPGDAVAGALVQACVCRAGAGVGRGRRRGGPSRLVAARDSRQRARRGPARTPRCRGAPVVRTVALARRGA